MAGAARREAHRVQTIFRQLATVTFLFATITASATEWTLVATLKTGEKFYVRDSSISKSEKFDRAWLLVDVDKGIPDSGAKSALIYSEFDCSQRRLRRLQTVLKSDPLGRGDFLGKTNEEEWTFITPESTSELLWYHVCIHDPKIKEAKIIRARKDLEVIELALALYRLDNGQFPSNSQGLEALHKKPADMSLPYYKKGGYVKMLGRDPWGNAYRYQFIGANKKPYKLLSLGPDGMGGSAELDKDNLEL